MRVPPSGSSSSVYVPLACRCPFCADVLLDDLRWRLGCEHLNFDHVRSAGDLRAHARLGANAARGSRVPPVAEEVISERLVVGDHVEEVVDLDARLRTAMLTRTGSIDRTVPCRPSCPLVADVRAGPVHDARRWNVIGGSGRACRQPPVKQERDAVRRDTFLSRSYSGCSKRLVKLRVCEAQPTLHGA